MLWLFLAVLLLVDVLTIWVAIWLAARVVSAPETTWRRAAVATLGWLLVGLVFLVVFGVGAYWGNYQAWPPTQQLLALAAVVVGFLVAQGWVLGKVFVCDRGRAATMLALALLMLGAVQFGVAYVFKEHAGETFVVPTGAMATAIYGQHADVTCPQCGWQFAAANFQENQPIKRVACCTNCGEEIELDENARVSGDCIIVDKTAATQRWDCAIYIDPEGGAIFVKRLVGFPGETVGLSQGDLFINQRRVAKQPGQQQNMWREFADSSFVPKTPMDDTPGWRPAVMQPEKLAGKLHIDDRSPAALWQYDGEITNEISYNTSYGAEWHRADESALVWDVRVHTTVESVSDDAVWGATWDRDGQRIECELRGGEVTLTHRAMDFQSVTQPARVTEKFTQPSTAFSFAFSRRDGWAYVEINDQVVAKLAVASDDWHQAEKEKITQPRLELFAQAGDVQLRRLRLATDVHYLAAEENFAGGSSKNPITLAAGEYFFLGDNSRNAKDCRYTGPAAKPLGVARWGYWPPERWRRLD